MVNVNYQYISDGYVNTCMKSDLEMKPMRLKNAQGMNFSMVLTSEMNKSQIVKTYKHIIYSYGGARPLNIYMI